MEDAFFPYIFFLGGGDMMDGEGSSSSPRFSIGRKHFPSLLPLLAPKAPLKS
jgi:hypothetical protein